jgi:serine/threonine protein kinase
MFSSLFRGKKSQGPYSIESNAGSYVFTSPTDCTAHELILFLLDLHLYVVPLGHEVLHKFPDPTECVQYSFSEEASAGSLRRIALLDVLKIGFIEKSFESSDALRQMSDDDVLSAVRDLAVLSNQVPSGHDLFHSGESTSVMPLDGILACMDILMTVLNTSQTYLEREYAFTAKLLPALSGLLFVLDRIGGSIGHSSTEVTKYQWTQTIGQTLKYLTNLAVNVTVHNVNCTMDMDAELPPLHGSRSMSMLVKMLQLTANGVVVVREWCHPEAASTIALLFWSTADAVSDAVIHLQSKDRYIVVTDGTEVGVAEGGTAPPAPVSISTRKRPECTRLSVWNHSEFLFAVTHSIYKCVSNASPAPQDMLAGIGRLAGRSENYQSEMSLGGLESSNETANMLNWCAVAHTITGFKSLLRAAIFSATGDRIALPRQNEWVSAISESLLFCLEFGYRSRNLTLLAPVMAELLLELIVRQSDCSVNVDTMFFDLAAHMNKFSEYYKKRSRIDRKKKKKKGSAKTKESSPDTEGFHPSLSKSIDLSDARRLSPPAGGAEGGAAGGAASGDLAPAGGPGALPSIRRVQSAEEGAKQGKKPALTIDALKKNNIVNKPSNSITRGGTYSSSVATESEADKNGEGSNTETEKVAAYHPSDLSPTKPRGGNTLQPLGQPLRAAPVLTPLRLESPAGNRSNGSLDGPASGSGSGRKKKGNGKKGGGTPLASGSGSGSSNIMSSPRAPLPITASPPAAEVVAYLLGQSVDCRITMKNESIRWFSGKVESLASEGLYTIRFDDGDLGAGVKPVDLRVSKRAGRSSRLPSVRSARSDTSASTGLPACSPVAGNSGSTVTVNIVTTPSQDSSGGGGGGGGGGGPSSTAREDSLSPAPPARHAVPAFGSNPNGSLALGSSIGSLGGVIDPIIEVEAEDFSPAMTAERVHLPGGDKFSSVDTSNSMCFSNDEDDEDKPRPSTTGSAAGSAPGGAGGQQPPSGKPQALPPSGEGAGAGSLSSVADFGSKDLLFTNANPSPRKATAAGGSRDRGRDRDRDRAGLVMTDLDDVADSAQDGEEDASLALVAGMDEAEGSGDDDDDDGFTFTIPSVFAETDIQRRVKNGGALITKINFDNVDMDVTAAMNGAAATSLSGGIVRDKDSTVVKQHSDDGMDGHSYDSGDGEEEGEDESVDDDFGLAYLYDSLPAALPAPSPPLGATPAGTPLPSNAPSPAMPDRDSLPFLHAGRDSPMQGQETDSEQPEDRDSQSKDSSYSYSNSSGFASIIKDKLKRVPSLKGFTLATNQEGRGESANNFHQNTLGSFNMTSKNAAQPPRPASGPLEAHVRSRNEVHGRPRANTGGGGGGGGDGDCNSVNGGGSVVSRSSTVTTNNEVGGSDQECRQALQRTYAFVSLVLLERAVASRDRIEEKFCRPEETVTTNRSRNSSYRVQSDYESPLTMDDRSDSGSHRNVVFAVREFLDTSVGKKVFASIATNATLVDQATTRLLKLVAEQYFDSCIPGHMKTATRLAEGAFGNVYRVTCPTSCSRCYSRKPVKPPHAKSLAGEDSPGMNAGNYTYAVKRISRERSVYDMPVLIDIYTEVSCLELLCRNKGVCRLFNYGIQGGEYWLVLECGRMDLSMWRQGIALSSACTLRDLEVCVALYEDACVIVRSIHDAGVVHFDLKCSNFLLRGNPKVAVKWWNSRRNNEFEQLPSGVLFIADFGESVINRTSDDGSSLIRQNTNGAFGEASHSPINAGLGGGSGSRRSGPMLTSPKFRTLLQDLGDAGDVKRARGSLFVQSPEMLTISSGSKSAGLPQKENKKFRGHKKKEKDGGWISFAAPSYASDVWSLGCLLVELITMSPLFVERPWPELYCLLCMKGKKSSIDGIVSKAIDDFCKTDFVTTACSTCQNVFSEFKNIVPKILVQLPSERPSITHILHTVGKLCASFGDVSCTPPPGPRAEQDPVSGDSGATGSPDLMADVIAGAGAGAGARAGGKKSLKPLRISTSGPASKYSVGPGGGGAHLTPVAMATDAQAVPSPGPLYADVQDYIANAVDAFDDVKMTPSTCFIAPRLYVSLSVCANDVFSYEISNALVVDITAAPSALYEYNTSNILGECMNRVRNCEKTVSMTTYNSELIQKTIGYLHKDKRLIEIFLVCENQHTEDSDQRHDASEPPGGCFFFKLRKRKTAPGGGGKGGGRSWVPWGGKRHNKVHAIDADEEAERQSVYKFNLGVGDPAQFFECFKHAVLFVHKCNQAGHVVLLSISGRCADAGERAHGQGSSRWNMHFDGPAPALSARSHSFDSNMRKMFTSSGERPLPSARSVASSANDTSFYPSSTATRLSTTSGQQRAQSGDFSRPLMSALAALISCTVSTTKTYSTFYDQPVAPLEKMAPWLLRGCQKETVMCLVQYSRLVLHPKSLNLEKQN